MKSPSNDRWVSYLVAATAAVLVLLFGLQRFGIWQPSEVHVADLARDLITLSGLRPGEDIEIQFTGIRPGEKLFEELAADEERADKTRHPKIFVGRFRPYDWEQVELGMVALHECSDGADDERVRVCFKQLVPEYNPVVLSGPPGTNRERRVPTLPAAAPDERANVIPLKRG